MGKDKQLYEFAASTGALEGYVYSKRKIDKNTLPRWVDHLIMMYRLLDEKVREDIQLSLNGTIGRTIQSLIPVLGKESEIIKKLKTMVKGENIPKSPDDFKREKWFKKG